MARDPAKKRGVRVAAPKDRTESPRKMRLDSDRKQFKYRKVVDIIVPYPAVAADADGSKVVQYFYNEENEFDYIPAYEYYVKGYNGRWGTLVKPSFQSYSPSYRQFPYFASIEYMDAVKLFLNIVIQNSDLGGSITVEEYPAHDLTIRLFLFHDPLQEVA